MKKALVGAALYALPFVALAQTLIAVTETVSKIVNLVVPIVGAIVLIYFFIGVIGYVNAGGEEEKRTEARNTMIYAVIGMFVAFSVFGLAALLRRSFGVGGESEGVLPGLDVSGYGPGNLIGR